MTEGDSITASGTTYFGFLTLLRPGTKFNAAQAGRTIADMVTNGPNVDAHYSNTTGNARNIATILGGTNGCGTVPAATQWSQLQTWANDRRAVGWRTVVATIPSQAGNCQDALNAQIRTNWTGIFDALADIAADPNIGCDGCYTNLTYFNADGIHPTPFAQQTILAPIFQAAINGLIP